MIKKFLVSKNKLFSKSRKKLNNDIDLASIKSLRMLNKNFKFQNNFKYNLYIDLKDEKHLSEIKMGSKYQKYILKESYMQKIILRNQLLIIIDKIYMIKEILNDKAIFEKKLSNYNKRIIDEIIIIIKFLYSILKLLFKESIIKINDIIFKKSPIHEDVPIFYEFENYLVGLKMMKKIFVKVFDYFKDCIIAFFLICTEIKDQFYNNIEIEYIVNTCEFYRLKISKFIEFYKLIVNTPNKEEILKYSKRNQLNKFKFLTNTKNSKLFMSTKINLNIEANRGINNFSKNFKIYNSKSKKHFKTKENNCYMKEKINIQKNNNGLNDWLNYLKNNKSKIIPKEYKKYLKNNY